MYVHQQHNTHAILKEAIVSISSASLDSKDKDEQPDDSTKVKDSIQDDSDNDATESETDCSEMDCSETDYSETESNAESDAIPDVVPDAESDNETTFLQKEPISPGTTLLIAPGDRKSKKSAEKKSVRFYESVICRLSLHKNNYTPHEVSASWYGQRDYEKIREDVMTTLSLVQAGNFVEMDCNSSISDTNDSSTSTSASSSATSNDQPQHAYSSRGLERFTRNGSMEPSVRKLRQKAITAVLVEQEFQVHRAKSFNLNYLIYNDDSIRNVYKKQSKIAAEAARSRGISDYHVAAGTAQLVVTGTTKTKQSLRKRMIFKSSSDNDTNVAKLRWSLRSAKVSPPSSTRPNSQAAKIA